MKLAVAGKGGVGKTTFTAWLADYLARRGLDVWLVDADTALSLGQSLGLAPESLPVPLIRNEELIRERVGSGGFINLAPLVSDLPEKLSLEVPLAPETSAKARLLLMGSVAGAGGGCACGPNSLLKALLAHLVLERDQWLLVDLEAGVEHLGRGTVAGVDGLVVVSEPSYRGLSTAASIGSLARDLGLDNQVLVINRGAPDLELPRMDGLPPLAATLPFFPSLAARQLAEPSVLDLPERDQLDDICRVVVAALAKPGAG